MLNIPPNRVEWETSYVVPWFTIVHNIPLEYSETIFIHVWDYLQNWWEMINLDEKRSVNKNKFHNAIILIEYVDRDILESDKVNNTQIKLKNAIQSTPVDDIRQIAENIGDFDWNGKYYLVVYTYNSITDETLPERWIFKWVIVDMEKYNLTKSKPEILESQVAEKVEAIFPHKI